MHNYKFNQWVVQKNKFTQRTYTILLSIAYLLFFPINVKIYISIVFINMHCIRFDVCYQEICYILYPSTRVFYMLIYLAKHRITLLPLLPICCTSHLLNCLRLCFASSRMCPTLDRFGLLDGCIHNCWRIAIF